MTNDQTVTQADRDAVADVYALRRFGDGDEADQAALIRSGHCDHWDVVQAFARHRTAHSGEATGRFADYSNDSLAAQCRMQARENLDPEYSQFMTAVADRLAVPSGLITFEEAWAKKEAEGYRYGRDALENVRFGWEIAHAAHSGEGRSTTDAFRKWLKPGQTPIERLEQEVSDNDALMRLLAKSRAETAALREVQRLMLLAVKYVEDAVEAHPHDDGAKLITDINSALDTAISAAISPQPSTAGEVVNAPHNVRAEAQAIADRLYPAGNKAANSRNYIAFNAALEALSSGEGRSNGAGEDLARDFCDNWRGNLPSYIEPALAEFLAQRLTALSAPQGEVEREAVGLLKELRDNIGAASLARNPIGISIRDRVDMFLRAALAQPEAGGE